jgi:hypothetical protein
MLQKLRTRREERRGKRLIRRAIRATNEDLPENTFLNGEVPPEVIALEVITPPSPFTVIQAKDLAKTHSRLQEKEHRKEQRPLKRRNKLHAKRIQVGMLSVS